ncbi:hypothetical protein HID58_079376 [Brassica napus]|uniref:Uncharacterized protein n=1 Tax=Brassica napus TaxID=3708 RepID=A0ABQ7Y1T9_BRANA|nr:hypothetical protein HID58_079376 [Brassica napus]
MDMVKRLSTYQVATSKRVFLSGIGTAVLAVYEFGTRTSVYRFCAMQFHDTYELEQNWSSSKA